MMAATALWLLWGAQAQAQPVRQASALNLAGVRVLDDGSFSLSVACRPAREYEPVIDVKTSSGKLIEFFLTALAFPDDKFWIDLNPASPDRVADRELAKTDFGRIMLAADLQLKKDTSDLTNPRKSKAGKEFWERLYRKAEGLGIASHIPVADRVRIMPGEICVRRGQRELSILSSRLSVVAETAVTAQDQKTRELLEYGAQQMKELIIPELERRVNDGYAYAELRELFQAMVCARWYKDNFGASSVEASRRAVADFVPDYPYGEREIYNEYMDSLRLGEYSLTETVSKYEFFLRLVTRTYTTGGLDFTGRFRMAQMDGGTAPAVDFSVKFDIRSRTAFALEFPGKEDLFGAAQQRIFEDIPFPVLLLKHINRADSGITQRFQ
jgi:hypothetical protein